MGVVCTVVREMELLDGDLIELADNWFAQDRNGNVWYFGENSMEIENGAVVGTAGWEAGVDGVRPGIVMLGNPRVGKFYARENVPGVAESMAKVVSLKKSVEVPFGSFDNCLVTKEWSPLEPGNSELRVYAPGVGLVQEKGQGTDDVLELVDVQIE
jgi:hypothetical protein